MPTCRNCLKVIPENANVCPFCSTPVGLKKTPMARMQSLSEDIDRRLNTLEKEIDIRLGVNISGTSTADTVQLENPVDDENIQQLSDSDTVKLDTSILLPDSTEVENLRKVVFESHHVESNPQYSDIARHVLFNYHADDPRLNAYATQTNLGSRIVLFGGLVQMFSQIAFVITAQAFSGANHISEIKGRRSLLQEHTEEPLDIPEEQFDSFIMHGRELLGSMVIYIIAHELGHVVYGHIYGPGYERQPIDISRNQERDADSFASSVIASSRYASFLVIGQILALYVFAIIEKETGVSSEPGTHPIAKERLRNAIRGNSEVAQKIGITEQMIDELFPD